MGYRIVKQAQAWWPVEWDGVAEDGTIVTNRIEMRFRLLKVADSAGIIRDAAQLREREQEAMKAGKETDLAALYAELVERIATDWRGVEAENGEPLPWQAANVALLMNEPGLFGHVVEAFRGCLSARPQIRAGN
ncbi:MAG TPA: histidine kinase [Sphingomonas sp.]|nr:histidine kinase [Sphingomonas sp.]